MITTHRPTTSLARLLGAGLLAAPLTLGALGLGHAYAAAPSPTASAVPRPIPALTQLVPAQQNVSGYARTPDSVAVSGNTAVVGSIGDRAAYVFVKTASGWAQQARLADPSSNVNDLFGSAVAIHGNSILVGDPAHIAPDCNATPNQQTGAVFQFDRSGTTWKPNALGPLGCSFAGDKLGAAVAFDGTDAVLGAPGAAQNRGVAYLLHQISLDDWQQQQVLRAGDGQPGDAFGTAVAINGATEALVGAPAATVTFKRNGDTAVTAAGAGVAYTFRATGQSVKSGNAWAEESRFTAPTPTTGAAFGTAVALSGNRALIGAPFDKNGASAGAAYLATRGTTGWGFPVALATPAGANQFGGAVSLGTAGRQTTAVIGDYGAQAAFVFSQSGTSFTPRATLRQAGALGLGSAVATDGTTALLGAIYGNNYQGSAYAAQIGATAPAPVTVAATTDDTDPSLVYSGAGWGYYGDRPASFNDLHNDVHATLTAGDAVSYTFSGTGVSYISEKSAGYGRADVYIDGTFKTTVNPNSATARNLGGQTLYSISGLPSGRHTIKVVSKDNGLYTLIDTFTVK